MISILCNALKEIIDAPYLDKKYGLVFSAKGSGSDGNPITFPIEDGEKTCSFSRAAVPDAKYRALSYFESNGPTVSSRMGEGKLYISYLSLVVWMNTEKININDPFIGDKITGDLEKKISSMKNVSFDGGSVMKAMVSKLHSRSHDIFSKYSYPDKSKYLAAPYNAIKLDFEIHYSLTCGDVVMNPKSC